MYNELKTFKLLKWKIRTVHIQLYHRCDYLPDYKIYLLYAPLSLYYGGKLLSRNYPIGSQDFLSVLIMKKKLPIDFVFINYIHGEYFISILMKILKLHVSIDQ